MRYAEAAELLATSESIARKNSTPAGERLLAVLLTGLGKARTGVDLYSNWHAAQPGKGYDTKAKEWKAKLGAT